MGRCCSWCTISVDDKMLPVYTTNCTTEAGMGAELCNGTLLNTLSWTASKSFVFEEYWTSSSVLHPIWNSTVSGSWAIGNSGYFLGRPGNAVNQSSVISRMQRPALYEMGL